MLRLRATAVFLKGWGLLNGSFAKIGRVLQKMEGSPTQLSFCVFHSTCVKHSFYFDKKPYFFGFLFYLFGFAYSPGAIDWAGQVKNKGGVLNLVKLFFDPLPGLISELVTELGGIMFLAFLVFLTAMNWGLIVVIGGVLNQPWVQGFFEIGKWSISLMLIGMGLIGIGSWLNDYFNKKGGA